MALFSCEYNPAKKKQTTSDHWARVQNKFLGLFGFPRRIWYYFYVELEVGGWAGGTDGVIGVGCVRSSPVCSTCRRMQAGMPWGNWRGFGAFCFSGTSCAGFAVLQCKQHGGEVPAMQMYPCPPSQVPHVCCPTTEPNANNIAEAEFVSERWLRPHRGSPATLWSVSERVASGGRPTTHRRMTRRGVAGQWKSIWYLFASGPT